MVLTSKRTISTFRFALSFCVYLFTCKPHEYISHDALPLAFEHTFLKSMKELKVLLDQKPQRTGKWTKSRTKGSRCYKHQHSYKTWENLHLCQLVCHLVWQTSDSRISNLKQMQSFTNNIWPSSAMAPFHWRFQSLGARVLKLSSDCINKLCGVSLTECLLWCLQCAFI